MTEKTLERDIEFWETDQQFCDIANAILQKFVEKQITVSDSLRILDKAKKAVEKSVQSASWGTSLVCEMSRNEAPTWHCHQKIVEEIKRRDNNV